jgi:N-methylhydantoinase A
MNLDHYPNRSFDVTHEELDEEIILVLVSIFKDIDEAWAYLDISNGDEKISRLTGEFDDEHEQLFTFKLGDGHEILMIRAVVKARAKAIADLHIGQAGSTLEECKLHDTRFYYEGAYHEAGIYDRNRLHEGLTVPGPAIISEMDSTTVVLPAYEARVDAVGNLLINPGA